MGFSISVVNKVGLGNFEVNNKEPRPRPSPWVFHKCLKEFKIACLDTVLQVLILKSLGIAPNCTESSRA
jgi:hypothetical protein